MLAEVRQRYPDIDLNEMASEHDYDDVRKKFPGEHVPPNGCLLLARQDEMVCGCIALGKLTDTICEMRTLFVRPSCRGEGVGRQLTEACLNEARKFGYKIIRLDTLQFMTSAQTLYRSMGFNDIEPYLDLSDSLKRHICFMECEL
jgi:N-acetylglutamate synthase-like GNAT family acetyltransferase